MRKKDRLGTYMFLVAGWSHQAGHYEDDTKTKDDEADLHRQVDAKNFVFA